MSVKEKSGFYVNGTAGTKEHKEEQKGKNGY